MTSFVVDVVYCFWQRPSLLLPPLQPRDVENGIAAGAAILTPLTVRHVVGASATGVVLRSVHWLLRLLSIVAPPLRVACETKFVVAVVVAGGIRVVAVVDEVLLHWLWLKMMVAEEIRDIAHPRVVVAVGDGCGCAAVDGVAAIERVAP